MATSDEYGDTQFLEVCEIDKGWGIDFVVRYTFAALSMWDLEGIQDQDLRYGSATNIFLTVFEHARMKVETSSQDCSLVSNDTIWNRGSKTAMVRRSFSRWKPQKPRRGGSTNLKAPLRRGGEARWNGLIVVIPQQTGVRSVFPPTAD